MNESGCSPLICHSNLAGGFRGGERQTELLIRNLASRGWRQRLVVRRGTELASRCVSIEQLEIAEVSSNPLAAALAARGSALLHAHEARSVYAGWLLARFNGVPYLLTRRVDSPFKPSIMRRLAYHGAAEVVCLSDAIVQRVREQYPDIAPSVVPSAHAALANGTNNAATIRQRFPGKTVIGHIGALIQRHKGQQTIIDAARAVADSNPELMFLLVGSGEDETAFRDRADGLANIEFAGQVVNIADYLAAFDVFIFPSLHEGLGSSLLDAMSFGLPLVASNVGGIAEIVADNVNGILIPPNDAGALVAALRRLCSNAAMRESMRDANLQKAATYSADRMAEAYETIYRSILTRQEAVRGSPTRQDRAGPP